jgi:hypothetical protein
MFRALGARILLDWKGIDGVDIAGTAAQLAWQWAVEGLTSPSPEWAEADITEGSSNLHTIHAADADRELYRTVLNRPDPWDPSLIWRTTIDITRRAAAVEAGICVEQDMRHHRIPPSPLQPPLVGLLQALVTRGARVGKQRVSYVAQAVVGPGGVEDFVNQVLLDRERRLPVLLFTNVKEQDGAFPEDAGDPSLAARELCGQAHVYVMPRTEDTHRLTRRLGMLSAYDGAVRIYWPRFHLSDPPPRHPLHLRQRLNKSSGPAIIRRVIEAGARSYRPPDGTGSLLALRWREQERARIDALLSGETDTGVQAVILRGELDRAVDENVRLEHEIEALRDQLHHTLRRAEELELRAAPQREAQPEAAEATVDLPGEAAVPSTVSRTPEEEVDATAPPRERRV